MVEGDGAPDVARLVADHHQAMYRYAYRLTGSQTDAEDLTQQVFLVAHQRAGQIRDSERSWLFAVLRNCYLRNRRRRRPVPAVEVDFDINAVADEVPAQPIDGEELQAAIDQLDDDFKIVVLLFYFEHCSYREIAERLGIPAGTVMSRLARAKAHLRRRLSGSAAVWPSRGADAVTARPVLVERSPVVRH